MNVCRSVVRSFGRSSMDVFFLMAGLVLLLLLLLLLLMPSFVANGAFIKLVVIVVAQIKYMFIIGKVRQNDKFFCFTLYMC